MLIVTGFSLSLGWGGPLMLMGGDTTGLRGNVLVKDELTSTDAFSKQ